MSTPPPGAQPDPMASRLPDYNVPAPTPGPNQFAPASGPTFGAAGQRTLIQRNATTLTAMCVVALYLFLAASTGIVLVGIFPAMLAFRALQRREPLAVLAVGAAAVAIIFSVTVLTHH